MGVAGARVAVALLLIFTSCSEAPEVNPDRKTPSSPLASSVPSPSPSPTPDEPTLVQVGSFDEPIHVASPRGDDRLFVVEKGGRVKVVTGSATKIFIDISADLVSQGERGLFSIAFPEDHGSSGLFYLSYTDRRGDSRVVEYKVSSDKDAADPATRRDILHVDQPFSNHNGGLIVFDPTGMLVLGLGDGGSGGDPANRAQDLRTLLGKLVRIDPRKPSGSKPYSIPADNPFVGKDGAAPEILAYGLRNPWRFWFDLKDGTLWLADVGQNRFEEVNRVERKGVSGANFGWRKYEGTTVFAQQSIDESKLVRPVHVYPTGPGGTCAVTGGSVYRGDVNKIAGLYLFADVCQGAIKGLRRSGAAFEVVDTGMKAERIVSFGEDARGRVHVVSQSGPVYRIAKK